jgi:tricarballylate dehydrogenase
MEYDVIVVGAGNAGLCAAMSAKEHGAKVLVVEKAPYAGGDGRYSEGGLRFTYDGPEEIYELRGEVTEAEKESMVIYPSRYTRGDYYRDWMEVTRGRSDSELISVVINRSNEIVRWLRSLCVELDFMTSLAFKKGDKIYLPAGTPLHAKGAGEGLIKYELNAAEKKGIPILYNTKVIKLLTNEKNAVVGVRVKRKDGISELYSKAVILAAGGFQANVEMRTKYLGPEWALVKLRGSRYNTGEVLNAALEIGAQPYGHYSGCHCAPIDLNAPDYESKMASARYSYPFCVYVDQNGQRFLDEGEDFHPKSYVKVGRLIIEKAGGVAYQIFDSKVKELILPEYERYGSLVQANSIEELAEILGIPSKMLKETISRFNQAVKPGTFNPGILDGKSTEGIYPPKSNWALTIEDPPFIACPTTTGITFTMGGLRINKNAQVLDTEGEVIKGLYASGIIVGGLFYYTYAGGCGLMAGATFGYIAGANAALES